jgi:hypothetical protein
MAGEQDELTFTWNVTAEQIDLDHWARSVIALHADGKGERLSQVTRFGIWPLYAVWGVVLLVLALSSVVAAIITIVVAGSGIVGARLWNRGAGRRLARRLRALPAASEPFTFHADTTGTGSRSASAAEELAWSNYRSVEQRDDLVALRLQNGVIRLLPIAALTPPHDPTAALQAMARWIGAANADTSASSDP